MIGKRILIVRNKAGLNKKQLANLIGSTAISIGNWEAGKNQPREQNKRRIEQVLGLSDYALDRQVTWEV